MTRIDFLHLDFLVQIHGTHHSPPHQQGEPPFHASMNKRRGGSRRDNSDNDGWLLASRDTPCSSRHEPLQQKHAMSINPGRQGASGSQASEQAEPGRSAWDARRREHLCHLLSGGVQMELEAAGPRKGS